MSWPEACLWPSWIRWLAASQIFPSKVISGIAKTFYLLPRLQVIKLLNGVALPYRLTETCNDAISSGKCSWACPDHTSLKIRWLSPHMCSAVLIVFRIKDIQSCSYHSDGHHFVYWHNELSHHSLSKSTNDNQLIPSSLIIFLYRMNSFFAWPRVQQPAIFGSIPPLGKKGYRRIVNL